MEYRLVKLSDNYYSIERKGFGNTEHWILYWIFPPIVELICFSFWIEKYEFSNIIDAEKKYNELINNKVKINTFEILKCSNQKYKPS